MPSEKQINKVDWSEEAWQNWIGFWNLILQEDMKQNPDLYKKNRQKTNGRGKQKEPALPLR